MCIESFITTVNFLFLTKLGEKLPSAQVSICSLDIALGALENLELLKLLYNLGWDRVSSSLSHCETRMEGGDGIAVKYLSHWQALHYNITER